MGDSIIAEFASPVDAILAAVEFQKNIRDRNNELEPLTRCYFGWVLILGMIVEGDNLYGDGVNVKDDLKHYRNPEASVFLGKSMMRFGENLI